MFFKTLSALTWQWWSKCYLLPQKTLHFQSGPLVGWIVSTFTKKLEISSEFRWKMGLGPAKTPFSFGRYLDNGRTQDFSLTFFNVGWLCFQLSYAYLRGSRMDLYENFVHRLAWDHLGKWRLSGDPGGLVVKRHFYLLFTSPLICRFLKRGHKIFNVT